MARIRVTKNLYWNVETAFEDGWSEDAEKGIVKYPRSPQANREWHRRVVPAAREVHWIPDRRLKFVSVPKRSIYDGDESEFVGVKTFGRSFYRPFDSVYFLRVHDCESGVDVFSVVLCRKIKRHGRFAINGLWFRPIEQEICSDPIVYEERWFNVGPHRVIGEL